MGSLRVGHSWATSLSLFTFQFHALEKEMATHSSVLAWRIPGTVEPSGLPSMGLHRVGHDWSDLAAAAAACVCQSHCPSLTLPHLFPLVTISLLHLWLYFSFVKISWFVLFFKILHINDIIWWLSFSVWLTSLSMTVSVHFTKVRLVLCLPGPRDNDGATLMERGRSWPGLSWGTWGDRQLCLRPRIPVASWVPFPWENYTDRVIVLENLGLDKPRPLRSFCGTLMWK